MDDNYGIILITLSILCGIDAMRNPVKVPPDNFEFSLTGNTTFYAELEKGRCALIMTQSDFPGYTGDYSGVKTAVIHFPTREEADKGVDELFKAAKGNFDGGRLIHLQMLTQDPDTLTEEEKATTRFIQDRFKETIKRLRDEREVDAEALTRKEDRQIFDEDAINFTYSNCFSITNGGVNINYIPPMTTSLKQAASSLIGQLPTFKW